MVCDNPACGKTVHERVGQREWFEVAVRPQLKPTLLNFDQDPESYGPPVYKDACSGECLALIWEKDAGHLPKTIEQIAELEEKATHAPLL